jgi:hypothetical protein
VLPNAWTSKELISSILLAHGAGAGSSFIESIPGGLPQEAISVLVYLSATDRALSDAHQNQFDRDVLIAAVSDAHHRLMCLPPWPKLSEEARAGSFSAIYECCRLSAILYSMCVIFPVPVASGWHLDLLGQLHHLHETARMLAWPEDTSALLVWSSLVAAIAAHDTVEWVFFRQLLESVLEKARVRTWREARQIVRKFIWTDAACEAAALLVGQHVSLQEAAVST